MGSLSALAKTVETAVHELAPRYEGMDPFQIETICRRGTRDVHSEGTQIRLNAVAAIEIAAGTSSATRPAAREQPHQ